MDVVTARVTSLRAEDVLTELMAFYRSCNSVLSVNLLSMVNAYMKTQHLATTMPQVYGLVKAQNHTYDVTIKCWLVTPNVCQTEVKYKISGP